MKFVVLIGLVILSGCSYSTRQDVDQFVSVNKGHIKPEDVSVFADCLMDGFRQLNIMLTAVTPRKETRANGYRVETTIENKLLIMSADVLNDGKVELFEYKNSHSLFGVWSTEGEKEAFKNCLNQHKKQ
ncbi:hypothetical protein A1359_21205 [Methylomonas lenta]|uniref:Lipoprotein n=1 Tax=Methylomonas lenta TaxID=980561 RepID=A0A177NRZ5_9GAMM|nr:hypothetical protein [Methylomonas lenta]OAI20314.1 hypothetical protein A1359_21205 [Methylomonas lenta]